MTTISSDNTVSAALSASMNPKTASATGSTGASGTNSAQDIQDRFMKLLVTQMQNQDPLNPMDNSQVTSQMAQLSTVSGIDKLNTAMGSLQSSYQASQSLAATSMIGRGVLAPGSGMTLSNGSAVFGVDLPASADAVTVAIKDGSGKVVHTESIGAQAAGTVPLSWDGSLDGGGKAADGHYSFSVTATSAGKSIAPTALSFATVGSVSTGTAGVKLNFTSGSSATMSDVRQIL
jgi:flagellar basal-body rod modification protein FlgD